MKIKINLSQKIITLQKKKQFEGHTTTKHNSRNEEYKTAKRTRQKPRRLVVMIAITTRKLSKGVPTPQRRMTLENKYDQSRSFNK